MKKNKLIASAALAIAALAITQKAFADEPDLILGFQDTTPADSTYNYEVDLGEASLFTSLENTGTTIQLNSNSTSDSSLNTSGGGTTVRGALSQTALSSDYANLTSGNVYFSVAGTTSTGNNEYFITDLTGVPQRGSNDRAASSEIDNLYGEFDSYAGNVAGTDAANVPTSDGSTPASGTYSGVAGSTGSYNGNFVYTTQAAVPSSGSVKLNLYDVTQGSGNSTLVGYFTLDSSGDLSFTSSVPEPSTYVLLAIGAVGLYFGTRRKNLATL